MLTSYINLSRGVGRGDGLTDRRLVGATAGAVTLSGLNLLSEFVPAFGAHAFPGTMAASATPAGWNLFRLRATQYSTVPRWVEAKQRIVQTQTAIQSELIDAAVKQLKQLEGPPNKRRARQGAKRHTDRPSHGGTILREEPPDVPVRSWRDRRGRAPDAETVIIPSGQNSVALGDLEG